ncbi:MFS transporter [Paenibacillus sp. CAA11]|uniref:MFS transporter n=1 Tax=Paenibacillus sp. CAA11 TaxID=1532905 RepID=UPI000D3B86DE|nr:MFS transporter [Paenibacillus sp. CAA11]AWB44768.1 MFS transporter [Paenibacillus sp. CAA11]
MNLKIFVLTIATFTVGLVELIIGGVLPMIAGDLNVSLSTAGQLITIYALVYAISGPTLLAVTGRVERKKLYLWSMLIFTAGSLLAAWSPNYAVLFATRIITAASGSLIVTLSLTIAVKIVPKEFQARVIGIISMGVSSSIVLGVPLGVVAEDYLGWRILFLIIGLLTLVAMVTIHLFLGKILTEQNVPLKSQLSSLKDVKIISAHLVTTLTLAGHYTLYAYFTPFLESTMHLNAFWISAAYFVFGLAAVSGGLIGGVLSDKLGSRKSILIVVGAFIAVLFLLPLSTQSKLLFTVVLFIWGVLSWALSPAQQSYLIQNAPGSSDIQQSFNFSALQVGIAVGSGLGGVVIDHSSSIQSNAWVGGGLMILAFLCAIYSLTRPAKLKRSTQKHESLEHQQMTGTSI